jgi:hypothetical protein
LLGFVVDHGGSYAMGMVFGIVTGFVGGLHGHQTRTVLNTLLQTTPGLWFLLTTGLLFDGLGGFVAGRVAPRERYWNAAAAVLIDTLWGFATSHYPLPLWVNVAGYTLFLPCGLLGAFLAGIGETEPPAPPPLPRTK